MRPSRPIRFLTALGAALLLGACGSSAAPGGADGPTPTPDRPAQPTPTGLPTPSPLPTLVATRAVLASGARGAGQVSAASDGDGFLVTWVAEANDGTPSIVAQRLDGEGRPRDAAAFPVATVRDVENDVPSDDTPTFDHLVTGFDGATYVVTWYSQRGVYQIGTEHVIFARRVAPGGAVAASISTLFAEVGGVGFCDSATSGPLGAATTRTGMLLFSVSGFGCANGEPAASATLDELGPNAGEINAVSIEPPVGVTGLDGVHILLGSKATIAARDDDALVRWVGGARRGQGPFLNGLWVQGSVATSLDLGSVVALASDRLGYIVATTVSAPSAPGHRDLRVARFDPATQRVLDSSGASIAAAIDLGYAALVAFAPGEYVLAYDDRNAGASAPLRALTLHVDDDAIVSAPLGDLDGDEVLALATASSGDAALLVQARRDGAGTFTVELLTVALRS